MRLEVLGDRLRVVLLPLLSRAPTVPEAPDTWAITTGWPRCFCKSGARGRNMLSVSPPAAHGTIILTGRSGYSAAAAQATTRPANASTAVRKTFFTTLLPQFISPDDP